MNRSEPLEQPLRGLQPYYYKPQTEWKKGSLQGPKRALRLCILCIVLPGMLIGVPLYVKHHVFAYQMYPVGMSDMRLIDGKVSTTWCQRQIVRANTTFNAFLLPELPHVSNDRIHVSMIRNLELSDDMKEYWGFYLLKGSTVTVSTCARWPGASMIMIRGHRHLQECAYIGDDSSEELEELLEIAAEKGILDLEISSPESPANRVDLLTKHRPEVQFHDQHLRDNAESYTFSPAQELHKDSEDDISGKRMRELLNLLPHKANKFKSNVTSMNHTNAANQVNRLKNHLKTEIEYREKLNKTGSAPLPPTIDLKDFVKLQQADHVHKVRETNIGNHETENVKFANKIAVNSTSPKSVVKADSESSSSSESKSKTSDEIMDNVLKQLKKLDAGKKRQILDILRNRSTGDGTNLNLDKNARKKVTKNKASSSLEDEVEILDMSEQKMGTYKRKRRPTTSSVAASSATTTTAVQSNETATTVPTNETQTEKLLRMKRELILKTVMASELSSAANEDENLAMEEGYVPDGIADHHHVLNQTNLNDRSNSEFWSSFSSSEETLLNCAGLILSLPLSPNGKCEINSDDADFTLASHSNTITYTVPSNGYYFFVFNSENEVQDNYIRVKFDIHKTVYNVSNSIQSCNNATNECKLPLNFFSNEKVVFELPINNNETLWNEEYVVISECEPRTAIYLVCVVSVPLMILFFAFQ